jgi:putative phosphoesterase
MRIGVISDTHVSDRVDNLPDEVFQIFRDVHLIIHAGDLCRRTVLGELQRLAPVIAVYGNRDDADLRRSLPRKTILEVGRWRIGIVHGDRSHRSELDDRVRFARGDTSFRGLRDYVRAVFTDAAIDCIIFGHSHHAHISQDDGIILFNPGGAVAVPGGQASVGFLDIDDQGIIPRIVRLHHPPLSRSLFDRTITRLLIERSQRRKP